MSNTLDFIKLKLNHNQPVSGIENEGSLIKQKIDKNDISGLFDLRSSVEIRSHRENIWTPLHHSLYVEWSDT